MNHAVMTGALVLALAVGALTVARSAPDPKGLAANQCFRPADIQNSVQMNESRLNILTRNHHYIRVDMTGRCFAPPFTDAYVLRSQGGGLICAPIDIDLSAGPPGFTTACVVDRISVMSPAEIAALPKGAKP